MNLGETIYRLRSQRNMSQGDLADALEVSRQSVSKWENNSAVPELEKIVRMSEIFGVTLDELVLEKKAQPNPPEPEVKTVYVEKSGGHRKTVGVILLCFAVMSFLALAFLAGILGALAVAAPFAFCGLICLLVSKHPGLWCGWTAYLWVDVYLRFATGVSWQFLFWGLRYDGMTVQTIVAAGEFAILLALILVTVAKLAKFPQPATKKRIITLIVLWGLFLLSWIPLGIAANTPSMIRIASLFNAVWGWLRNILLIWAIISSLRLLKGRNVKV